MGICHQEADLQAPPSGSSLPSACGFQTYWVCWHWARGQGKSIKGLSLEGVSGPGREVPRLTADHILFARTQLRSQAHLLERLAEVVSLVPRTEG